MKNLFFMLLAALAMVACDKDNGDEPKSITISDTQHLTQTVYADDNAGKSDVAFTTDGAWTSEIKQSASSRSTSEADGWISISPESGDKAGNYTIGISLLTNYTGEKRTATISLKCNGESVNIVITQEALTEAGDKPQQEPEPSGSGVLNNETTGKSVRLVGVTHSISAPDMVRITFKGEGEKGFEYMADFNNPLQDGKLKDGVYNVKNDDALKNGECLWSKSDIATYGESGTVNVEKKGNTYTFKFDITTLEPESYKVTGSFTGVPMYLNQEVKVESITLNENSKTLEMGESFTLTATILPENATDKGYTWNSGNTAVATVSEEGLVKSVAAGEATITATSAEGAKTATCSVTVKAAVAVTGITVEPAEVTLLQGEYLEFYMEDKITVLPKNATNKNITWKSSDESVAVYTGKGIEAKVPGNATVTFTTEDGGKTAELKVTVTERESFGKGEYAVHDPNGKYDDQKFTLIEAVHTVISKNRVELSFKADDGADVLKLWFNEPLSNGRLAAGSYTCTRDGNASNSTVYHLNNYGNSGYFESGSITVSADGDTFTFTADNIGTTNGMTATLSYSGVLTYTNEYIDVNSVTLNKTALSLTIGAGFQMEATVNPSNAFNKNVAWGTSNPSVANVNGDGYVYTAGVGTATITVTTEDGAKTASCEITVTALPSTGNGKFSNNEGQSVVIDRAEQWINEKAPEEIEIRFAKPDSAYGNLSFTLVRAAGDTGRLEPGTYTSISSFMCDDLGVKYSYGNTGTATVLLNGENYTVTLDITSSDGIRITGTYTGKITKV